MSTYDSFVLAWRQIVRRPRAAAMLVLGYATIVVLASVVMATARATRDGVTNTLWDVGAHSMAFLPLCVDQDCATPSLDFAYEGFEVSGVPSRLFPVDLADKLRTSPHIADVSPYLLYSMHALRGEGNWLVGGFDIARPIAFNATMADPSQIVEGRFLEQGDVGVLMLDRELARTHGYGVGDTLQMGVTKMRVVGIVRPPLRPGKAHIYMSIDDARTVITPRVSVPIDSMVNALLVESQSAFSHSAAREEIRRLMGGDVHITSFGCGTPAMRTIQVHMRFAGMVAILLSIGMSLLVLRAQAVAVHERYMEIAVMKCIGWSDRAVLRPLLVEAFVLAAAGSLTGAVGAVAIVTALSRFVAVMAGVRLYEGSVLLAVACSTGLGLVAARTVAVVAARARPALLLRKP